MHKHQKPLDTHEIHRYYIFHFLTEGSKHILLTSDIPLYVKNGKPEDSYKLMIFTHGSSVSTGCRVLKKIPDSSKYTKVILCLIGTDINYSILYCDSPSSGGQPLQMRDSTGVRRYVLATWRTAWGMNKLIYLLAHTG